VFQIKNSTIFLFINLKNNLNLKFSKISKTTGKCSPKNKKNVVDVFKKIGKSLNDYRKKTSYYVFFLGEKNINF